MATTTTPNLGLLKPAYTDQRWDVPILASMDLLDAAAPLGNLAVTITELPSASLNVRVAPGSFCQQSGTVITYAGSTAVAIPASTTACLWLTDAGVLAQGSAFPATCVRLATVTAGSAVILAIADARVVNATSGPSSTQLTITTVTANYTAGSADNVIRADATSGAVTITLPAASSVGGRRIDIKKVDSTSNAVTVASNSPIDGSYTVALASQWSHQSFIADAASNTWGIY